MALPNSDSKEFDKLTDEDKDWLASLPEEEDYEDGELGVTTTVFFPEAPKPVRRKKRSIK